MAVYAARVEGHDHGRPQTADHGQAPFHCFILGGEAERAFRGAPALHARISVAEEDRLGDAKCLAGAAQLLAPDLRVEGVVYLNFARATALVAVGRAQDPDRIAERHGQSHDAASAVALVVGVGEDRQQTAGRREPVSYTHLTLPTNR